MQITVLADNFSIGQFRAEFGLALFIEHNSRRILFDTGAGFALPENLKIAGIAPEEIKEVILSHGHSDHTGGLSILAPEKIFAPRAVTDGHFSLHADGSVHDINMPQTSKEVLAKSDCCFIDKFTEIGGGLSLSGYIPRISTEDCGGNFFHDSSCTQVDNIDDEIFLLSSDGILISGCCHAGIINSLSHAKALRPEIKIHTIIGGLHLRHASTERLQETAAFIKENSVKNLYLMHCTGENAIEKLRNLLPDCNIYTPVAGESIMLTAKNR